MYKNTERMYFHLLRFCLYRLARVAFAIAAAEPKLTGDVLVPVFSGVLVPEPNSMHQLMDHSEQNM